MTFDELKEKAHALPLKPGVYIMQDAKNEVIYVGKAKALKNRVSQYFANLASHTEKTRAMVGQIDHFDVIVADSEFEALILENSLIKRHQPRYNILLKDDKGYPYIRLTVKEDYPKFSLANRPAEDGARYFGPYGSRGATQGIIDALRLALRLPSCHKKFPRDIGRERPCLNYHMGQCDGYCRPGVDQGRYREAMDQAVRLLEGKFQEVGEELQTEMARAAEELRFEKAAELRDRYRAIELLSKRQKVVAASLADTDVVGFHRGEATRSCFVVLHYVDGELAAKDWDLIDTPMEEDTSDVVSALVRQYYGSRGRLPGQILLPCELEDEAPLTRMLSEQAGCRVSLVTPQRGAKMDLIRLANKNAAEEVERWTSREERQNKLLELLGRMLDLEGAPRRMESYDISNQGADDIVASMVVYVDGKPLKRDYRQFKLKDMAGPDDYAAMEQVLTRRFQRYLDGDEKFAGRPDLLLIDGGENHARVAVRVLETLGLSIPVFGMVKDDRHRTRALVTPDGREIGIQGNQAVFSLIGQIQEETHRFAIEFHRQQQARRVRSSVLDQIPGVGEKRRAQLLKHFKSVKNIRAASREQLEGVVPKNTAKAVYDYFQTDGKARP
ncbi:excinuclease ABC subunit UvrC [Flavonifractor sp. DFI.6.63]|uniref:UvrABC system protein C n=1 Tax=Lawsonibacter hominis TaxID=2763053 RepID=A0A8J6J221_9FIRM|nr:MULTISPECIES: excinuclease ABC subunit UvrC [Oscillospiraceae]MBC5732403.1 excinuclease ABC subunit UvrC [Lawsonibacter hominis]MBS1383656.1 excinuclease ABC subunit UvrC [Flavonifractor sp.]MCQ5029717.1 excinuclease ABC subunit UvrC [Flavonifractor sp. DFI.6.63]MDU2194394.1 excinuclease ABC subunit UvrC [Clostridiales bacterium]